MSKASQPDEQNGTLFADSIKASSLDRLHQQAGQKTAPDQCHCVNLALATREPSTEDILLATSALSIGAFMISTKPAREAPGPMSAHQS